MEIDRRAAVRLPLEKSRSLDQYSREKLATLAKLCELLCMGRLRLREAANEMGTSLATASRLKREAEDLGILRTKYYPPAIAVLEQRLQEQLQQFGIREVLVCATSVPQMAARYFEETVHAGDLVILDGGGTVREFVYSLSSEGTRDLRVMPICADPPSYAVSAYELSVVMAVKYHSLSHRIKIPYSLSPNLKKERSNVEKIAGKANFVFLGVGPWKRTFTASEFVHHFGYDPDVLRRRYNSVKAVCGYFAIDGAGSHVVLEGIDDVLPRALPFAGLQKLAASKSSRVVLLARSRAKIGAVQCAILARVANTLIVDEELATVLLRKVKLNSVLRTP